MTEDSTRVPRAIDVVRAELDELQAAKAAFAAVPEDDFAAEVTVLSLDAREAELLAEESLALLLDTDSDVELVLDGHDLDRTLREAEAEGVAYLVSAILGDEGTLAGSRHYLQNWYGDKAEVLDDGTYRHIPEASAHRIFKAVDIILHAGGTKTAKGDE